MTSASWAWVQLNMKFSGPLPGWVSPPTGWPWPPAPSTALAIRADGSLWAWGRNVFGQLGLGSADTAPHPTPVQVGTETNWLAVAGGFSHSLGLRADGSLYAWGFNDFGQLGLGDNTRRLTPVQVGTAKNWVAVTAGDTHSLGLRANGSLWAWGDNFHGQLGLGDDYPGYPDDCLIPTQVSGSRWGRPTRPNAGLDLLLLGN
jgi:alpha-tubulin suppressor-like RCC1 family protein